MIGKWKKMIENPKIVPKCDFRSSTAEDEDPKP